MPAPGKSSLGVVSCPWSASAVLARSLPPLPRSFHPSSARSPPPAAAWRLAAHLAQMRSSVPRVRRLRCSPWPRAAGAPGLRRSLPARRRWCVPWPLRGRVPGSWVLWLVRVRLALCLLGAGVPARPCRARGRRWRWPQAAACPSSRFRSAGRGGRRRGRAAGGCLPAVACGLRAGVGSQRSWGCSSLGR